MTPSSSIPRAIIDLSVIGRAASAAVASGATTADLRGDAYGHGLRAVARTVREAGVDRVLVDTEAAIEAARAAGLRAVADGDADIAAERLYGLGSADARPSMSLVGRIISTKALRAGEGVSYGYTHRASRDTTIALVTGGYAQGVVRALGNVARVEIAGASHPIVGRVAMDVCVVDLETTSADAAIGADVTFFGGDGAMAGALRRWADATGLTASELVTVVGAKAVREWRS